MAAVQESVEEERTRMLFCKLRQVMTQKFGYGVKENKFTTRLLLKMKAADMTKLLKNGAFYHIKRLYRELITFRIETVNVITQEGELKGRKLTSVHGKTYYRFQGVPYAKPPIGPLRFKDPEPPESWKGVRSALKEGDISTQADIITGLTRGSENCLFLNVFTPELPQEGVQMEGKAVMVWIHGGGFYLGSGNAEIYGPDFLISENVILITLNYRLGVLGFLSTGTEDAPGNAGLKDIVMALKWVQRNIAAFGGDPNKVTIFGESAGAAAVHFMMLSPLAKGLFRNAISQSGSALCPWALNEDPVNSAFRLGRAFGIDTNDPKILVDYLRKVSPKVLAKKQSTALSEQNKRECLPIEFLPCVEPASYPNAFITEHPWKMVENNMIHSDVPYISGVNEMEGAIMLKSIVDKVPPLEQIERDFERLVPKYLALPYGSEKSKIVAQKLREFYFNNKAFTKETYKEYSNLTTDSFFLLPSMIALRLHSKYGKSPIYNYKFLFDGEDGLLKKILNVKDLPGPVHADELAYLFHCPILAPKMDPKSPEVKVSRKICKLWANFAKYGTPMPDSTDPDFDNVEWKTFSEENPYYLTINENMSLSTKMNEERLNFWSKLKESMNIKGYTTLGWS